MYPWRTNRTGGDTFRYHTFDGDLRREEPHRYKNFDYDEEEEQDKTESTGCLPCMGSKSRRALRWRKKQKAPPTATVPLIQVTEFAKIEKGQTLRYNRNTEPLYAIKRPRSPRIYRDERRVEERRVRTLPAHFKYQDPPNGPANMHEIHPLGPGSSAMAAVKRLLEITAISEKHRDSNLIAEMVYERFAPSVLPEPKLRPLLPPDWGSESVTPPLDIKTDIPEYDPVETDDSAHEEEVKGSEGDAEADGVTKKPKRTLAERIARMARRLTRRLGRGR